MHPIDYDATGSAAGFDSNSATAVTYDDRHIARTMGNRKRRTTCRGGSSTSTSWWVSYEPFGRVTPESPVHAKNGCPGDVHTIDYDAAGSVSGFDSNSATAVTHDERHLARTMGNRKLTYDLQGHLTNERIGGGEGNCGGDDRLGDR